MPHREIPVQVTAWIDEGVAELVMALNAWPGVVTLDSCEADYRTGRARVSFCTYERAQVFDVLPRLAAAIRSYGLDEHVSLSPWPAGDDELPGADITCLPGQVSAVANALAARTRPSPRGTDGRAHHSLTARRYRRERRRERDGTGQTPG